MVLGGGIRVSMHAMLALYQRSDTPSPTVFFLYGSHRLMCNQIGSAVCGLFKNNLLINCQPESAHGILGERLLCFRRNVPGGACRQEARHSSFRNPTSTIRQISSQRKRKWGYKVPSFLKSFFQGILSGLRTPHRAQASIPGQLECTSGWGTHLGSTEGSLPLFF